MSRIAGTLWTLLALVVCVGGLLAYWFYANKKPPIEQAYSAGELSSTLHQLSNHPQPADGRTFLLMANCLRQLGRNEEFHELLKSADQHPEWQESKQLALALFNIQHGTQRRYEQEPPDQIVQLLIETGASPGDAHSVVVQGLLALNKTEQAQQVLDRWRRESPGSAQLHYLSAVHQNVLGNLDSAETQLLECTERFPRHELSWLALAELYARPPQVRFEHSRLILTRVMQMFPDNKQVRLRLSNIQRRLGQPDVSLVESSAADKNSLHREFASTRFDLGEYREALAELQQLGLSEQADYQALTDRAFELTLRGQADTAAILNERVSRGATAFGISGHNDKANAIFETAANRVARLRRLQDLGVEQAFRPGDRALMQESQNTIVLSQSALQLDRLLPASDSSGLALYRQHCASCHGENGNGRGTTSVNLDPPARNFREEPMRLISTANKLADDDDLKRTIRLGIPGSSMPAFSRFTPSEESELIALLRSFMREGLREQYQREFADGDQSTDQVAQETWIAARSVPDSPIVMPEFVTDNVNMGLEILQRSGCLNCHPLNGEPARAQPKLFDSLGRPMPAPDLARDAFHGTDQPAEIAKRVILGIPGTPHPSTGTLTESEVIALVAQITNVRKRNQASRERPIDNR